MKNYTLYLGDCLEIMKDLDSVDAVITDPPFGQDYKTGQGVTFGNGQIANDENTHVRDAIVDYIEAMNIPGLVFGTWKIAKPKNTHMVLVWDSLGALGMGDLRLPWKPAHKEIYVLGNPEGFTGKRTSDVIRCAPVQSMAKNGRLHPMEKPVDLLKKLILKTTADVILDPCMGSGSTGEACAQLGRKFIGIEIDPDYFEIARKRIETAYMQKVMF